jgi:hypothetical protein
MVLAASYRIESFVPGISAFGASVMVQWKLSLFWRYSKLIYSLGLFRPFTLMRRFAIA